jgi:triacylglycerol lipase
MTFTAARLRTRWILHYVSPASKVAMYPSLPHFLRRHINETQHWRVKEKKPSRDPRINDLGRAIQDDFATIRDNYGIPMLFICLTTC